MGGIRLGSVRGVPVLMSWTVLLIAGFVAFSTYSSLTTRSHIDSRSAFTIAAVFVIGYGVSVFVHEVGHTIAAQGFGIKVRRIVLVAYGGAAELESAPRTPHAEFLVAIAGPAGSALCALGFGLLGSFADTSWSYAMAQTIRTLAWVNVIMVVINLLPGLPLDGGRVMMASAWAVTGSKETAAKVVSITGAATGAVALVAGFVFRVRGTSVAGIAPLWIILIGVVLLASSQVFQRNRSGAQTAQPVAAKSWPVSPPLPAWASMRWYLEHVIPANPTVEVFPLVDRSGGLVGVLTSAHARSLTSAPEEVLEQPAAQFAWDLSSVAVATPNESEAEVASRTAATRSGLCLLMQGAQVVGAVGVRSSATGAPAPSERPAP